jgi:hypothetical protein
MKRIFTLLLLMAAVAVNAQSIKMFYQGENLNNQDTVFLPVDNHGNDVDAFFGYQNTTNTTITYKVRKEVIFKPEEADMMFCIGDCYTGDESGTITMEPNETVTEQDIMALHIIYSGSSEPAFVKYTLYRTDVETEDATSFYIVYGSGSGVREADMVKALRAFPNPAVRNVTIEYVAPAKNSSLVIKNLAGKEVYRVSVSTAGAKQIDVSSMSAGVYFYGIEADGKMLCTKKLLIK